MKKSPATFHNVGSFIAGSLVALSLGVLVLAMMDMFPDEWPAVPIVGALIILALGIALQIVATSRSRPRRRTDPEPGAPPIRLVVLHHQR